MNKIKIKFLMDCLFHTGAGTEGQVIEIINISNRDKYSPSLILFQPTEYGKKENIFFDIKVLNIRKILSINSIVKMLGLGKIIRKENVKIVSIYFNDAAILAPFFCKMAGAKVLSSRRDMGFWYTPMKIRALKWSNHFVDRIVVNSHAVKQNVMKYEGYPEEKISVIYNGHEEKRFNELPEANFRELNGIGPTDPIIGMLANLWAVKRPIDLVKAFQIIYEKYQNAHVVFVGGGMEEITRLEEYINSFGMREKIHFLGARENVIAIIKHFDVCVLCSESEGLSNAIIEYMACSKPVICTKVGGNSELIKDGFNGYLINVGDIEYLAKCILDLLSNDILKKTLGENGRKLFLNNFTRDKMARAYMRLYDSVLNYISD
jgi:glycosyltransferase involved in cell wall biosynthesis